MTIRSTVLFTSDRKAAPGLFRMWTQQGAAQPLQLSAVLLEEDGSATRFFRSLWALAFPTRDSLPFGRIGTKAGTGTDEFWEVFS